jgi:pre-mRNA-processing factor 6
VELDKDNGDCWAHLYLAEKQYDPSALNRIREEFLEAEPHHGELWCSMSKRVENWSRRPQEILELISINPK